VLNQIKPNDSGRQFLGSLGEFRPARQSGGGGGGGEASGGQHGRIVGLCGADIAPEGGSQSTDEYEVSVESSTNSAQEVSNWVDQLEPFLTEYYVKAAISSFGCNTKLYPRGGTPNPFRIIEFYIAHDCS
jgi:hypothetical protein